MALPALTAAWRLVIVCVIPAAAITMHLTLSAFLGRRLMVVTVRGESMAPAYRDGDRLLVRRGMVPDRGHVVVVERPYLPPARLEPAPHWLIKRVTGVPGDPVPRDIGRLLRVSPGSRVPPGRLILLGDNKAASLDSRQLGYFPAERVLGTAVRRLPPR
ncbi:MULTISPECIES: S26 family signal peptidase [Streptomyces]|uniref:S26 family signal peptidase n=1 Tax=Streptomyces TaxID=1883 RepID=UPI0018EF5089|nr:S26 family signal peptidase [Streptomyces sp. GMR22]